MLRHSSGSEPGISRKRVGRYWAYFDPGGKRITDRSEIDRLNAIGLPPAYDQAWFCADPNGHLQATGVDARGRKQYRYHADFRAKRESAKYEGLLEFGKALPKLRRQVDKDLRKRKLDRETVLAAVIRLLDTEHIRIGNEQYARENKSFGVTTLRSRHVKHEGSQLMMRFAGKHGIIHEVPITGRNLRRIVTKCHDLPGQHLFQYLGEDGEPCPVTSADVIQSVKRWGQRDGLGQKMMAALGSFEAKNDKTFVMTFKEPFGMVLEALSKPSSNPPFIMPKAVAETLERTSPETITSPRRPNTVRRPSSSSSPSSPVGSQPSASLGSVPSR